MLSFHIVILTFHVIKIPFDRGANQQGSQYAPNYIMTQTYNLDVEQVSEVRQGHVRPMLKDGYAKVKAVLDNNAFPLTIGGDHTIAISSVSATNDYCREHNLRLGVLWCDAHADFNTIETSPSGNLHGVPVAVLCGHTLPFLSCGSPLQTKQFAFFKVRDIDEKERTRFNDHDMKILNRKQIARWMKAFDKIHVSFDMDCLDPSIMSSVNTPVPRGATMQEVTQLLSEIKETQKLIGMDIVEFNPTIANDTKHCIRQILTSVFSVKK